MTGSKRHTNDGIRKLCGCPRRKWAKCATDGVVHPWHFNFKWNGEHFRFSLERRIGKLVRRERELQDGTRRSEWRRDRSSLGRLITNKTEAQSEAQRLKVAIKDGSLLDGGVDRPNRETLTLEQLMDTYRRRHLDEKRKQSSKNLEYQIPAILRTPLERPDGCTRPFGDWLVVDIKTATIDQFQAKRSKTAPIAANRDLALLRAMFSWAVTRECVDVTPFKRGTEAAVRLARETKRRRRLRPGEGERLLAACGVHLRPVVEAAIETGMRRGEILSLQWSQVKLQPKAEIFLPAQKTKTKSDRTIPISTRLKAILEMRRHDPAGEEHPPEAYVFGNEVGQQVKNVKRAWQRALLKAHGFVPRYTTGRIVQKGSRKVQLRTGMLTPECLAALAQIDLHFHDLRREAGSRWLDGGVPLHRIKQWLGHANISQTSTYLEAEAADNDEAMRRYEERLQPVATGSQTGAQRAFVGQTTANANAEENTQTHH